MSTGSRPSSEEWSDEVARHGDEIAWRDDEIARLRAELVGRATTGDVSGATDVELTSREGEVLDLIAQGLSTQQIADALYLGVNSIKTHTQAVFRKIGVTSRTQAALWALANRDTPGHGPGTRRATG